MVYLLHFGRKLKHAQHYLGYINGEETLEARIERHRKGDGVKLLKAVVDAGIDFQVV